MKRSHLLFATGVVACLMLFGRPAGPWEFDEILFYEALHHYDPVAHHPPPPGYPLFIGAGKIFRAVLPTDFAALETMNVVASTASFALLALAFGAIAADAAAGLAAALLLYLSPAMLVHATVPQSDAGAVALVALALWLFAVRRNATAFGAVLALAVGWRLQFAIFVVPLLAASLFVMETWRERVRAVLAFTVVCLIWLLALVGVLGGIRELIHFETGQARYLAAHDADQSRSGWTAARVAFRFIAHPWGMKLLAFPLLATAAVGAFEAMRRRLVLAMPVAFAGAVYLAFALKVMDPADGVRYAIPFVVATALFAGIGAATIARWIRVPPVALAAIFGAGAIAYVGPMIMQRSSSQSPPVRAAEYAKKTFGPRAVALYELPLWPHAMYLLRDQKPMRIDPGLSELFDRPDVPLFIYADGASSAPGARVFRWFETDAYSKLTRNHYRVSSVIPLPPDRRFKPLRGVFQSEREIEGDEWRWLAPEAALGLPHSTAGTLDLTLGLPRESILDSNAVAISVDGVPKGRASLSRAQRTTLSIPLPPGARIVEIRSERSVVPAEHPETLNRDARRLAVKMYDFHLRDGASVIER